MTSFNKNLLIKTFLMVWSVFNYLLTQKLARKAKVALGCSQYKKLLKTLKVAQKLPSTTYLCLASTRRSRGLQGSALPTELNLRIEIHHSPRYYFSICTARDVDNIWELKMETFSGRQQLQPDVTS